MAAYLRPTAPIAADALLPADPGLALALAQRVLTEPLMANHNHGLWGYSGRTQDGAELTIQATGIGAPSAAAVLRELRGHGVRRALRIGRCTALAPGLEPGHAIRVTGAVGADGVSVALGVARSRPDPGLERALAAAVPGAAASVVAGHDLDPSAAGPDARASWLEAGAGVADLETAALLGLGERLEIAVAAALVVAEGADGAVADEELVEARILDLGEGCARALAAPASDPVATGR